MEFSNIPISIRINTVNQHLIVCHYLLLGIHTHYTKQVPINDLKLDGEYLIKIYHQFLIVMFF